MSYAGTGDTVFTRPLFRIKYLQVKKAVIDNWF